MAPARRLQGRQPGAVPPRPRGRRRAGQGHLLPLSRPGHLPRIRADRTRGVRGVGRRHREGAAPHPAPPSPLGLGRVAATTLRGMFELPPEIAELQQTVRRMAQERVAPRAREIDETNEYPQDLFDLFVETGLTGLV